MSNTGILVVRVREAIGSVIRYTACGSALERSSYVGRVKNEVPHLGWISKRSIETSIYFFLFPCVTPMQPVELTESERANLDRILACEDLGRQRRLAYPMWAFAAILLLVGSVLLFSGGKFGLVIIALAMILFLSGKMRYSYYRCFRFVHFLAGQSDAIETGDVNE